MIIFVIKRPANKLMQSVMTASRLPSYDHIYNPTHLHMLLSSSCLLQLSFLVLILVKHISSRFYILLFSITLCEVKKKKSIFQIFLILKGKITQCILFQQYKKKLSIVKKFGSSKRNSICHIYILQCVDTFRIARIQATHQ